MGRIVISENVSLDGVAQDPTGEEGFKHGGWFNEMSDRSREAWAEAGFEEALASEALLMGRRSDEYFATRWMSRSGPWAERLNGLPKYVVSSRLKEPRWGNSTVLTGDVVEEVSRLRQQLDGDIVVIASCQLVPTLMDNALVDEVRLMVHPVILGAGERLFGADGDRASLRLLDTKSVGDGLAHLVYEVV
jgi:dihydrofolate reductase